ncbi:MAG: hypothetical protein M3Z25_14455 [Actinomycetota bacterium]|nr:hypothetical protein [Actinomycetota bacterium]
MRCFVLDWRLALAALGYGRQDHESARFRRSRARLRRQMVAWPVRVGRARGALACEDVTFRYPGNGRRRWPR